MERKRKIESKIKPSKLDKLVGFIEKNKLTFLYDLSTHSEEEFGKIYDLYRFQIKPNDSQLSFNNFKKNIVDLANRSEMSSSLQPEDSTLTNPDNNESTSVSPKNVKNNLVKPRNRITQIYLNNKIEMNDSPKEIAENKKKTGQDNISRNIELEETTILNTFDDIGGMDSMITELKDLANLLSEEKYLKTVKFNFGRGILIAGPYGVGKSILVEAFANQIHAKFYTISCNDIINSHKGKSEQYIQKVFDYIQDNKNNKMVVLFKNLDLLCRNNNDLHSIESLESRISFLFSDNMKKLANSSFSSVFIFGTAISIDGVDPYLRKNEIFEHQFSIGIPNFNQRKQILYKILKNIPLASGIDFDDLSEKLPGFTASDIIKVTKIASKLCLERYNQTDKPKSPHQQPDPLYKLNQNDFDGALKNIMPSFQKDHFVSVTDVTWDSIGALAEIRKELYINILGPIKHAEKFDALNIKASSGILLVGPPGCGKTLIAKAIANEARINFISIRGPEILSMYVGESERTVREIFSKARNSSPCVIFFDEIDSICLKRVNHPGSNESSGRLVNQLLTEMDGIITRNSVYILAATNRPDILDSAILRPGRFDKIIYVGLPSRSERLDILNKLTKNGTKPAIDSSLLDFISENTDNYTGADLSAIIREASLLCLKKSIFGDKNDSKISIKDVKSALAKSKSSISPKDLILFENMKNKYNPNS